jgi:hypothetical protein
MDRVVKIKVVEIPTSRINVKSSKKMTPGILPGVRHTLAPAMDKFGRLITGTTKEEYDKIMKGEINPPSFNEFFERISVKIDENGKDLNLSMPKHQLIYNFIKKLKQVADEKENVNPALHKFYIEDEDEKALKKLDTIKDKTKAYKIFASMSPEESRDMLVLYGKNASSSSDDVVQAKLGELVETNPSKFISLYNDNNREVKINLEKLTNKGVIRKEGKAYFYGDEGEAIFLGSTKEMAVEFLKDSENQELYIALISEL